MSDKEFNYYISGETGKWEVVIGLEVHAQVRTCLGPNNVRAPPCSPHGGLSTEGSGSRSTMPVRMKSLIGDYLGQSRLAVRSEGGA